MVETALCLPVFLFLSFGLIQLALIMQNLITVKNASIVAVRTAVIESDKTNLDSNQNILNNVDFIHKIQESEFRIISTGGLQPENATISIEEEMLLGYPGFKVTVNYKNNLILDMFGTKTITLSRSSSMW